MCVDDTGLEALFICIRKNYGSAELGFCDLLNREYVITEQDEKDMYLLRLPPYEMTYKEIGEIFGLSESGAYRHVEKYCKKHNLKIPKATRIQKIITQEQLEEIRRMRRFGKNQEEVAKAMGMSVMTLIKRLREMEVVI